MFFQRRWFLSVDRIFVFPGMENRTCISKVFWRLRLERLNGNVGQAGNPMDA